MANHSTIMNSRSAPPLRAGSSSSAAERHQAHHAQEYSTDAEDESIVDHYLGTGHVSAAPGKPSRPLLADCEEGSEQDQDDDEDQEDQGDHEDDHEDHRGHEEQEEDHEDDEDDEDDGGDEGDQQALEDVDDKQYDHENHHRDQDDQVVQDDETEDEDQDDDHHGNDGHGGHGDGQEDQRDLKDEEDEQYSHDGHEDHADDQHEQDEQAADEDGYEQAQHDDDAHDEDDGGYAGESWDQDEAEDGDDHDSGGLLAGPAASGSSAPAGSSAQPTLGGAPPPPEYWWRSCPQCAQAGISDQSVRCGRVDKLRMRRGVHEDEHLGLRLVCPVPGCGRNYAAPRARWIDAGPWLLPQLATHMAKHGHLGLDQCQPVFVYLKRDPATGRPTEGLPQLQQYQRLVYEGGVWRALSSGRGRPAAESTARAISFLAEATAELAACPACQAAGAHVALGGMTSKSQQATVLLEHRRDHAGLRWLCPIEGCGRNYGPTLLFGEDGRSNPSLLHHMQSDPAHAMCTSGPTRVYTLADPATGKPTPGCDALNSIGLAGGGARLLLPDGAGGYRLVRAKSGGLEAGHGHTEGAQGSATLSPLWPELLACPDCMKAQPDLCLAGLEQTSLTEYAGKIVTHRRDHLGLRWLCPIEGCGAGYMPSVHDGVDGSSHLSMAKHMQADQLHRDCTSSPHTLHLFRDPATGKPTPGCEGLAGKVLRGGFSLNRFLRGPDGMWSLIRSEHRARTGVGRDDHRAVEEQLHACGVCKDGLAQAGGAAAPKSALVALLAVHRRDHLGLRWVCPVEGCGHQVGPSPADGIDGAHNVNLGKHSEKAHASRRLVPQAVYTISDPATGKPTPGCEGLLFPRGGGRGARVRLLRTAAGGWTLMGNHNGGEAKQGLRASHAGANDGAGLATSHHPAYGGHDAHDQDEASDWSGGGQEQEEYEEPEALAGAEQAHMGDGDDQGEEEEGPPGLTGYGDREGEPDTSPDRDGDGHGAGALPSAKRRKVEAQGRNPAPDLALASYSAGWTDDCWPLSCHACLSAGVTPVALAPLSSAAQAERRQWHLSQHGGLHVPGEAT